MTVNRFTDPELLRLSRLYNEQMRKCPDVLPDDLAAMPRARVVAAEAVLTRKDGTETIVPLAMPPETETTEAEAIDLFWRMLRDQQFENDRAPEVITADPAIPLAWALYKRAIALYDRKQLQALAVRRRALSKALARATKTTTV